MNFHSNVTLDARPRVGLFTSLCFLALPEGPISLPKLTHICPAMITHVCCCPHWVSLSLLRALCNGHAQFASDLGSLCPQTNKWGIMHDEWLRAGMQSKDRAGVQGHSKYFLTERSHKRTRFASEGRFIYSCFRFHRIFNHNFSFSSSCL